MTEKVPPLLGLFYRGEEMNTSEKCHLKWCKEKVGDSKVQSPLGERFCSAKCLAEFNAALSELYKSAFKLMARNK